MASVRIRKGDTWYDMSAHALITILEEEGIVRDMIIPYVKLVSIEYLDKVTNKIVDVRDIYLHDAVFAKPTMCAPNYQITKDIIRKRGGGK